MLLIPWSVIPDPRAVISDTIPFIPDPTYLVTTLLYHLGDRFGEKAFASKILFIQDPFREHVVREDNIYLPRTE